MTGSLNRHNCHEVVAQIYSESDFKLIERANIFCYEYVESLSRLDELAVFGRAGIINKLGGVECLEADYTHGQQIVKNFECKSLIYYIKLYILSDFCLLEDVFEMFRHNSLEK